MASRPPNEKKRHHYIPIAYLKQFSGEDGRIFAYRKDDPDLALHLKPDEIALERYYYSQPLPKGQQDNNTIEDFFCTIEAPWPSIVHRMRTRQPVNSDLLAIFEFLEMMRVRVPAARDMAELHLAEVVKAETRRADKAGELPPKPIGHEDLLDHLAVSIDPHMSLHAMVPMVKGFGRVVDSLGFGVVHNVTTETFLTSDNPVVYFDPSISEVSVQPYKVDPLRRRVELFFPIGPKTVLRGATEWKYQFSREGIKHYELSDKQAVRRINRYVARFGYRFVFAHDTSHASLIRKYSSTSPVSRTIMSPDDKNVPLAFQSIFGERPRKPKWVRPTDQTFEGEI